MARTKNRYKNNVESNTSKEVNYRAGIYTRLSKERIETYREKSSSIENQEVICKEYAESNGIVVSNIYVDYQKTGTNFERSAYQELMNDIRNGLINCIIIRDLSRLGREYIEMGRLIDKVFPFLGVRFISVKDGVDTIKGVNDSKSFEIQIKNIVNAMYSRDISEKIKSSMKNKTENGFYVGSQARYGYKKKNVEGGKKLIVDEKVRDVVEYIFEEALKGKKPLEIAKQLNQKNIAPPMVYRKTGRKYRIEGDKEWYTGQICSMLHQEQYCGTLIYGKTKLSTLNARKRNVVDKENWSICENAHEAIVEKEVYDHVQLIMKQRYEKTQLPNIMNRQSSTPNRYQGIIYTVEGKLMCRKRYKTKYGDTYFYSYTQDGANLKRYKKTPISEKELDNVLNEAIAVLLNNANSKVQLLDKLNDEKEHILKSMDKKVRQYQNKINYQLNVQEELYEKYFLGEITKGDYLNEKTYSKEQQDELLEELNRIELNKAEIVSIRNELQTFVNNLWTANNQQKLDKELINLLIKRIVVDENRRVKFYFKFNSLSIGGNLIE